MNKTYKLNIIPEEKRLKTDDHEYIAEDHNGTWVCAKGLSRIFTFFSTSNLPETLWLTLSVKPLKSSVPVWFKTHSLHIGDEVIFTSYFQDNLLNEFYEVNKVDLGKIIYISMEQSS